MMSPETLSILRRATEVAISSGHRQVHFLDFLLALVESDSTKNLFRQIGLDPEKALLTMQKHQKVVAAEVGIPLGYEPNLSSGVSELMTQVQQCSGQAGATPELIWSLVVSEDNWRVARLLNSLNLPTDEIREHFLN